MKLVDLNPRFIGSGGEGVTSADGSPAPERTGVGVILDCPCGCGHDLYVPFANPLDGGAALEARHGWQRTGETFETLTVKPSIHRVGNSCGWHGWITNGEVTTV